MDLFKRLGEELPRLVNELNDRRRLIEIIKKEKYELVKYEDTKQFSIVFGTLTKRIKNNAPLIANIQVRDEKLEGLVNPIRRYQDIENYLHWFSHEHNIPLGSL